MICVVITSHDSQIFFELCLKALHTKSFKLWLVASFVAIMVHTQTHIIMTEKSLKMKYGYMDDHSQRNMCLTKIRKVDSKKSQLRLYNSPSFLLRVQVLTLSFM